MHVSFLRLALSGCPVALFKPPNGAALGHGRAVAAWLRKQLPHPLALFACNDIRGQQVLNACREHQIKVPEEVAVMGVDNDEVLCSLCHPPLTSIEPDTERSASKPRRFLRP